MIRHSQASEANELIRDWTRQYKSKNNLPFFVDAIAALRDEGVTDGGQMAIGFVGSRDLPGVTLRQAQAILRWDMRPSLWSHVFVVAEPLRPTPANTRIRSVSLHPRTGIFPRPERNGVTEATLGDYNQRDLDANVAVVAIQLRGEEATQIAEKAAHPNLDRVRFNFWDTLGVWQAFLWSFGQRPNPLRDGYPIPAASYIEYCYEAINLDLTPAASERNAAPEHIWNAAKWWQQAYAAQERRIAGYYVLRDEGCSLQNAPE